jgi:hypothetical protein
MEDFNKKTEKRPSVIESKSKHPIRDRLVEAAGYGIAPSFEDALALSHETRILGLSHAVIVLEKLEEISFS